MPLSFAIVAAGIATIAARRPSLLPAAAGPGFLLCGFLAFTYATYAAGPFGASIRSFPGYSSSYLGPGFWMMLIGTLLITGAGMAAEATSPQLVARRSVFWLIAAWVEFAFLYASPVVLGPAVVLAAILVALAVRSIRAIRRLARSGGGPQEPPPSDDHPQEVRPVQVTSVRR